MSRLKYLILITIIYLGLLALGLTYYFAYKGNFLNYLFWLGILLVGFPTFSIIINDKISGNHKIFFLFQFGIMLYIVHILPSTTNFHFTDELFTFETSKLVYEEGTLNVPTHFEVTKFYPGLEILTIFIKYYTNVDIFPIAKILIGIIHSLIPIFLYLFFKEISYQRQVERLAAIGAFIYATNPLYVFFDAMFAYESLGIFLTIVLMYMVSKIYKIMQKEDLIEHEHLLFLKKLSILVIIILPALVVTHHLSSIMFLLFLLVLIFVNNYMRIDTIKPFKSYLSFLTFFTIILIFGWLTYIATIAVDYLVNNFIVRFNKIFELALLGGSRSNPFTTRLVTASMLSNNEMIIDNYLYAPSILILSILGIYLIKKRKNINLFEGGLILFGPILYMASLIFVPTSGAELAQRSWGFLYIGLCFFVAMVLDRLNIRYSHFRSYIKKYYFYKVLLFISIFIIIVGGISIGTKPIHRVPSALSPKLVGGPGSMTTDIFASAKWFEENFGRYNKMEGERTTSIIFNSYGNQKVEQWNAWRIFLPKEFDENVSSNIKWFDIGYLIVDNRLLDHMAEYSVYFDNAGDYYELYHGYGSINYLPKESLQKFDDTDKFDELYDNGNILIYKIKKWW